MLRGLIAFLLLVAGWVAALWFGIAPDFAQWSPLQLAAVHALPPLGSSGFWLGWRRWRRSRVEERARAAEAVAEEERQASIEAARQQAAAEVARRRFGCDCRAVAMAQVSAAEDADGPLAEAGEGVHFSAFDPSEAKAEDASTLIGHLLSGIEEVLGAIYACCATAATLPIYVALPAQTRGDEFVAAVRSAQQALADRPELPLDGAQELKELGRVYQLPAGKRTLEGVIELFERTPGLAAVVLGSDSPWLRAAESGDDAVVTEAGPPGQGVFAVLLTHPGLSATGGDLPPDRLEALLSQPVLARVHRPATAEFGGRRLRANEFARTAGRLIEQAQINAGLAVQPAGEEKDDRQKPAEEAAPKCDWLVHNAGSVDACGVRLAGIGVALAGRGCDLDPVGEATNVSMAAGDLGDARGVGMLALAVAQAAATQGAALCVEFCGSDALSLFFAKAPEAVKQEIG